MAKNKHEPQEEFHPKGTALVLAVFVITLILLWGSVYLIMLSRGMTV
ncbi:MAG: cytochrome c oxidase subunit 2A [Anaerolineales bacterium]|nr:cytochrome c oxidase subunit 2A [Anaerolineales bacterium]